MSKDRKKHAYKQKKKQSNVYNFDNNHSIGLITGAITLIRILWEDMHTSILTTVNTLTSNSKVQITKCDQEK
jgi:hypothetical protein